MTETETAKRETEAKKEYEIVELKTLQLSLLALQAESLAAQQKFNNEELNTAAESAINEYRMQIRKDSSAKKKTSVKAYEQVTYLAALGVFLESSLP